MCFGGDYYKVNLLAAFYLDNGKITWEYTQDICTYINIGDIWQSESIAKKSEEKREDNTINSTFTLNFLTY